MTWLVKRDIQQYHKVSTKPEQGYNMREIVDAKSDFQQYPKVSTEPNTSKSHVVLGQGYNMRERVDGTQDMVLNLVDAIGGIEQSKSERSKLGIMTVGRSSRNGKTDSLRNKEVGEEEALEMKGTKKLASEEALEMPL